MQCWSVCKWVHLWASYASTAAELELADVEVQGSGPVKADVASTPTNVGPVLLSIPNPASQASRPQPSNQLPEHVPPRWGHRHRDSNGSGHRGCRPLHHTGHAASVGATGMRRRSWTMTRKRRAQELGEHCTVKCLRQLALTGRWHRDWAVMAARQAE